MEVSELRAKQITIVDEDDNPRMILKGEPEGSTIIMFDGESTGRLMIAVEKAEQFFSIIDDDQRQVISLCAGEVGGTKLIFTDENAVPRLALSYGEGESQIGIFDGNKEAIWGRPGALPGEYVDQPEENSVMPLGLAKELLGFSELLEKGHISREQFDAIVVKFLDLSE